MPGAHEFLPNGVRPGWRPATGSSSNPRTS